MAGDLVSRDIEETQTSVAADIAKRSLYIHGCVIKVHVHILWDSLLLRKEKEPNCIIEYDLYRYLYCKDNNIC